IEKTFEDLANTFEVYTGMCPNDFQMETNPRSIITWVLNFLGANVDPDNTASVGDGSNTAAPTNPVMSAVDNVAAIIDAGVPVTYSVAGISTAMRNNLRAKSRVGTLGAFDIGSGTFESDGT